MKPVIKGLLVLLCARSAFAQDLPPDAKNLLERFDQRFGVEILDGIGSAEMFHIYISNRLDDVRLGSLGRIVPGYEAELVGHAPQPRREGGEPRHVVPRVLGAAQRREVRHEQLQPKVRPVHLVERVAVVDEALAVQGVGAVESNGPRVDERGRAGVISTTEEGGDHGDH